MSLSLVLVIISQCICTIKHEATCFYLSVIPGMCPPHKSKVDVLTPKMMLSRGGACGRPLRGEDGQEIASG